MLGFGEQLFEHIEAIVPELPAPIDPIARRLQRSGSQPAEALAARFAAHYEPGPFEHIQVFGDRRLRHRKPPCQGHDWLVTTRERFDHLPPRGVRESMKDPIEPCLFNNHLVIY
jgi:hypothetical protein